MNTVKILTGIVAASLTVSGCLNDPQVAVHASFTTEKDAYEINEDIYLTNTSYAENARVIASKWEWGSQHMWGLQPETPISFESVGEYDITLTATSDIGNVSDVFVKTIKIQDTNIRPVADFTYEPQTGLRAGDTVTFTDKSSDEDGNIVAWEWKFGTTVVTEQNPEFTFTEFGDIEVTLTVTDNMKGTGSKTVTIHVDKSEYSLELLWEQTYETDKDAYVKFTSPATNVDGSMVYALSSGYHLAAFTKDGQKMWSFDGMKHNPNAYIKGMEEKRSDSCVPAVDEDGTVYIALGYNEDSKTVADGYESGVYAVNSDGSEKWYFAYGSARYICPTPVIIGDQIILTTKSNPTKDKDEDLWNQHGSLDNGHILNRNTGAFEQMFKVKRGSYGGNIGFKDGRYITHCDAKYGSRIYFNENGTWKHYGDDDTQKSPKSLGRLDGVKELETGNSSQMAADRDGKVYIVYESVTGRVSSTSVLYCYDTNKFVKDSDTPFEPDWATGIGGSVGRYEGNGVVLGEDGTVYVATKTTGSEIARVTAVSSTGNIIWESEADGNIAGSPAVDNEGYIYYNDYSLGKLVKLDPVTGKKVAEIQLGDELRSSPTISCDGTIYCTGMKDGLPTLFAVKGTATGHADSWSQLRGNPSKTGVLY